MKFLPSLLLGLALGLSAPAAEPVDLGHGLAYLRLHTLGEPDDTLTQALSAPGALVLDLRYVTTDDGAAAALRTALATHRTASPLFILVSPATPAALAPAIAASRALTLGCPGSQPAPKVVVQTDPASDRQAYDALATGTPLDQLLTGKIEKERFDESTLVNEFKNGNPDPAPPPSPDPTAAKPSAPATGKPLPLPADRVLQRTVHLHRALLALRR